jgi:hypothetical protein
VKTPVNGAGAKISEHSITIPFPKNGRSYAMPNVLDNFQVASAEREPIEAVPTGDGFSATLKVCKELGLDLSQIPPAILQIFYTSGVCFGPADRMPADARALWRNSIVWPIKDQKLARTPMAVIASLVEKQGQPPSDKSKTNT